MPPLQLDYIRLLFQPVATPLRLPWPSVERSAHPLPAHCSTASLCSSTRREHRGCLCTPHTGKQPWLGSWDSLPRLILVNCSKNNPTSPQLWPIQIHYQCHGEYTENMFILLSQCKKVNNVTQHRGITLRDYGNVLWEGQTLWLIIIRKHAPAPSNSMAAHTGATTWKCTVAVCLVWLW